MYLWGGMYLSGGSNINNSTIIANDMLIVNTINLSWGSGSLNSAPGAGRDYATTLLPGNKIIYIGKQVLL